MDLGKSIVIAALIISGGIALSNGVYEFETPSAGIVNRCNRFTGSVEWAKLHAPSYKNSDEGWFQYGIDPG